MSALLVLPSVRRAPSAQHPMLARLCMAQFRNPVAQGFTQLAHSTDSCENRIAFVGPGGHLGCAWVDAGSPGIARKWSGPSALLGMRQSIVLMGEIYNGGEAPGKGGKRKLEWLRVKRDR